LPSAALPNRRRQAASAAERLFVLALPSENADGRRRGAEPAANALVVVSRTDPGLICVPTRAVRVSAAESASGGGAEATGVTGAAANTAQQRFP